MSDKPRLFLHIGVNKTGTSFLQRAFSGNYRELARKGLLYPKAGRGRVAHYALSDALGFASGKVAGGVQDPGALREALAAEIERHRPRTLVLSSEMFSLPRDVARVSAFFDGYDCRIVVYLRRHDGWWESSYAQSVKTRRNPPWEMGFEGFYRFRKQQAPLLGNYRRLVERWAAEFGRENILVRPYERQQNRPDLLHDFMATIGRSDLELKMLERGERVNAAPSPRALALMDTWQRCRLGDYIVGKMVQEAIRAYPAGNRERLLSPARRRQLVLENEEDYRYIAQTYLGREDGRLFLDPLPGEEEPWRAPVEPTPVELVEASIRAYRRAVADPIPSGWRRWKQAAIRLLPFAGRVAALRGGRPGNPDRVDR